jgi:hypothetical protein
MHPDPVNRIILLGASNLTLSRNLAIRLMQQRCNGPSDVLVAAGHGRSFGMFSRALIRQLPGIASCGLWQRLEAEPELPTYAFVTDIGNDILYGHAPEQILQWVALCVDRMQRRSAQIVMTNLPLELIQNLSDWHFNITQRIFFPFSRLSKSQVVSRAEIVYSGLKEMACRTNVRLCEQNSAWFGPDIVHILFWKRQEVYEEFFEHFSDCDAQPFRRSKNFLATLKERRPRFAYQKLLGIEQQSQQPSGQLTDGTTISMY